MQSLKLAVAGLATALAFTVSAGREASATTYEMVIHGTVLETVNVTGPNNGDQGTFTFDFSLPNASSGAGFNNYDGPMTTGHVVIGSTLEYIQDPGTASIDFSKTALGADVTFRATDSTTGFTTILSYGRFGDGPPLLTLADLPTNFPDGSTAIGGATYSDLVFKLTDDNEVIFTLSDFTISELAAPTPTPIPATLPLLLTALGGFGVAAWHNRRATPAQT